MLWLLALALGAEPAAFEATWTLDPTISDDLAPVLAAQGAPKFAQRMASRFRMTQTFDVREDSVLSTVDTSIGSTEVVWTTDGQRRGQTRRGRTVESAYRWHEGALVAERWFTRKDGVRVHVEEVRTLRADGVLELTVTATGGDDAPVRIVQRFRPTPAATETTAAASP